MGQETTLADINYGLSREQLRNLKKAVGEQAAEMVNDCRKLVGRTLVAQQHLARECQALKADLEKARAELAARADGLGEWCATNEKGIADLGPTVTTVDDLAARIECLKENQAVFNTRTFRPFTVRERLRLVWAWLFGRAPYLEVASVLERESQERQATRLTAIEDANEPAPIADMPVPAWVPDPTYDHTPIDSPENPCLICKSLIEVRTQLGLTIPTTRRELPAGVIADEAAPMGPEVTEVLRERMRVEPDGHAFDAAPAKGRYFDDSKSRLMREGYRG